MMRSPGKFFYIKILGLSMLLLYRGRLKNDYRCAQEILKDIKEAVTRSQGYVLPEVTLNQQDKDIACYAFSHRTPLKYLRISLAVHGLPFHTMVTNSFSLVPFKIYLFKSQSYREKRERSSVC